MSKAFKEPVPNTSSFYHHVLLLGLEMIFPVLIEDQATEWLVGKRLGLLSKIKQEHDADQTLQTLAPVLPPTSTPSLITTPKTST